MKTTDLISGRLVAAARALTGISQNDLSNASGITIETLHLLESNGAAWIPEPHLKALLQAFDIFGVVIVPEDEGMGAGVRLKFTRQDVRQLVRLENEGGISRPDDVP